MRRIVRWAFTVIAILAFPGAGFDNIRTTHKTRCHADLRKTVCDLTIGAGVGGPHPAHTDNADPNRSIHSCIAFEL